MQWDRSHSIGMATPTCAFCQGYGMRLAYPGMEVPCSCVFRAIFRACYSRFRECTALAEHTSSVSIECTRGCDSRRCYSRKSEEYAADFYLVSRRFLNDFEHRLFRYYFLLGGDWRLCCRQMRMDRGLFFHWVYRIEIKLGRAFADMRPYPLFPLDEYFGGLIPNETVTVTDESLAA